jgi:nitroreductase
MHSDGTKTFDEIVSDRRSVRNYLERPVEHEKIVAMLEAARKAPSACNAQPWRYVVVQEPGLKKKVMDEGLGGVVVPNTWAKTAPCIIVACSNLSIFTHGLAERIQGVEYHLIDLGISLEHLVLKATELGLGTCYIGWFKGREIGKVLDLSSSWKVECLVTVGYPAAIPGPTPRKSLEEIALIK